MDLVLDNVEKCQQHSLSISVKTSESEENIPDCNIDNLFQLTQTEGEICIASLNINTNISSDSNITMNMNVNNVSSDYIYAANQNKKKVKKE